MVWMWIATLCAFFIKGLCGFANSLVFTTMMSFSNSIVEISPITLLLNLPTNLLMVWNGRKAIDWKICGPLCIMVLAGIIPGTFIFTNTDTRLLEGIFGIVVVLIALEMLLRKGSTGKQNRWVMLIIGVLSGMLCGLFGVGALLGAYLSRVSDDTHAFKGNMCIVFFVENTFRLILYIASGIITLGTLQQALWLGPVMLVSLWLGMKAGHVLNEKTAKKIVLVMLIISGIALIINSL